MWASKRFRTDKPVQCEIGLGFPGTDGKSLLLLLAGCSQATPQSPAGKKSTVLLTHLVNTCLKDEGREEGTEHVLRTACTCSLQPEPQDTELQVQSLRGKQLELLLTRVS